MHKLFVHIEAFYWLTWASLALEFLTFKKLKDRFGNATRENPSEITNGVEMQLQQIARALGRMRRLALWQPKCYPQAIAAKMMLRRRKIDATLYVGVCKNKDEFKAHAWTCSHDIYLCGGQIASEYTVIAAFK